MRVSAKITADQIRADEGRPCWVAMEEAFRGFWPPDEAPVELLPGIEKTIEEVILGDPSGEGLLVTLPGEVWLSTCNQARKLYPQ